MKTHLYYVLVLLAYAIIGCGAAPSNESAQSPEPKGEPVTSEQTQVTYEPQIYEDFEYDPEATWYNLTKEEIDLPKNEVLKAFIDSGRTATTFYLGNRCRLYTFNDDWEPMTLTLLNEHDQELRSVPFDLPPQGVVRIPEEFFDIGDVNGGKIRLSRMSSSEEFVSLVETELGTRTHARDESSATSFMIAFPHANKWELLSLHKNHFLSAGHSGYNGDPPTESWWARRAVQSYNEAEEWQVAMER